MFHDQHFETNFEVFLCQQCFTTNIDDIKFETFPPVFTKNCPVANTNSTKFAQSIHSGIVLGMQTIKSQTGQLGEDIACKYLVDKKYKIIERNYRQKWGELDIVARVPDKTLVFVEVKTLWQNQNIQPEDNLTKSKLKKLKRTACLYAGQFQNLIDSEKGWRIDLITITLNPLTNSQENCDVKHYENL